MLNTFENVPLPNMTIDNQYIYTYPHTHIYIYIQGVPKKTLFYVFAYISAYTYSRETSRISTELAWQEASNDMRLDFLRYLVHEKIDILCEILTLF